VNGEGTNQFGVFEIYGTAVGSKHKGNPTFNVELRKKYKASPNAAPAPASGGKKSESKSKKKRAQICRADESPSSRDEVFVGSDDGMIPMSLCLAL
jgi:hypothetical protein